jgi:uncharacterized membrane protein YoaK (UPF0700 family)
VPRVQEPREPLKAGIALLLSFAAGVVDVVGFLAVYRTFTAHMTGATVHLGMALMQHHGWGAMIAGSVIASFLLGSILGRAIIEIGARKQILRVASLTLAIEGTLLLLCVSIGNGRQGVVFLLLALLAASMGLQTATLTRVGALTVHTTFVTGMLNKFAQLVSRLLFESYDLSNRTNDRSTLLQQRRLTVRQAGFIFSIWCLYLAGAVIGTLLTNVWAIRALFVPAGLLGIAIVADFYKPLSVEEEKDQSER